MRGIRSITDIWECLKLLLFLSIFSPEPHWNIFVSPLALKFISSETLWHLEMWRTVIRNYNIGGGTNCWNYCLSLTFPRCFAREGTAKFILNISVSEKLMAPSATYLQHPHWCAYETYNLHAEGPRLHSWHLQLRASGWRWYGRSPLEILESEVDNSDFNRYV